MVLLLMVKQLITIAETERFIYIYIAINEMIYDYGEDQKGWEYAVPFVFEH
jgi:hypothetical protein